MKLILCPECAMKHVDEHGVPDGALLAMFGPQGMTEDEHAILFVVTKEERDKNPLMQLLVPNVITMPCDGCFAEVVVSLDAQWFLDLHAKQQQLH